jgi:hypothetical protein
MRVLIDRHQADLFYAMQLLFEDRLGIEVYTPVGYEWFDEGYWQFGHQHLGRALADQYLNIDAKYELTAPFTDYGRFGQSPNEQIYITRDPAHPDRIIRCVTLDQFQALGDWSHIVATVQDNQAGFARLAGEVGAKYVYQIGNTRQECDWSLDPLALVSSEVPILGRGVRMHQRFDHDTTFRYRPRPGPQHTISSFVNLMPRLVDWPLWLGYQTYLPEFTTRTYGIDGLDGNLHPVEAIAEAMAASAFGLQLKPTGDGFGHVLHNWAAIGRPLIGRASYYGGQIGARFWQDGVTCIDLDQRSPDENAAMIRDIYADASRYRAMCEAIRAEFDRIDWDGEAREIATLLL